MKKSGTSSADGTVYSTIEHYQDGDVSIAKVTVEFKGRTGCMTFTADKNDVEISFSSDKLKMGLNELDIHSKDKISATSDNVLIDAESELLLTSQGRLSIQALTGILNMVSKNTLNMGSLEKIDIQCLRNIMIKAEQILDLIGNQINIKSDIVKIGRGAIPVARMGDKVDLNSGIILAPCSTNLFVD